jgi:hypothetical protein
MLTSSSIGIIANRIILAIWFIQMGSQATGGAMSSAKNWFEVNAFKHTASKSSSRLDPGPHPRRAGAILEGHETLWQEVMQHHQWGQTILGQVLDLMQHGVESRL